MQRKIKTGSIFLYILLSLHSIGQESDLSNATPTIVYGDGFEYSIKTPDGWVADTSVSNEFFANIIFYENESDPFYEKTVILVYVFKKENGSLMKDLNLDRTNFIEENGRKAEEADFTINNTDFKCYNKLLFVKDKLHQYQVYLDPGKKYESGVSISMHTGQRKASESQLPALRRVVASVNAKETIKKNTEFTPIDNVTKQKLQDSERVSAD